MSAYQKKTRYCGECGVKQLAKKKICEGCGSVFFGGQPPYVPSEEQIEAECASMQSCWSESERRRRSGYSSQVEILEVPGRSKRKTKKLSSD